MALEMTRAHFQTCPLCEATCGITVTVDGDRVVDVRGDEQDPFSKGYICPKAAALADLHHDPDRLRRPMVREGTSWREVSWDEAFDLVGHRLREIRAQHGKDALAVYQGNPTAHNLGLVTLASCSSATSALAISTPRPRSTSCRTCWPGCSCSAASC
jgi:anaerobic selenocysteine-containing dehydrogenase